MKTFKLILGFDGFTETRKGSCRGSIRDYLRRMRVSELIRFANSRNYNDKAKVVDVEKVKLGKILVLENEEEVFVLRENTCKKDEYIKVLEALLDNDKGRRVLKRYTLKV